MALVTVQRSPSVASSPQSSDSSAPASTEDDAASRSGGKSLNECYFAGKGTAVVLPSHERLRPSRRVSSTGSDIQQHLQSMFYLLRPEETLKMAVKLESAHFGRTRYLVVVSCCGRQICEESCLLGIDCNERTTIGLVLKVLADTSITLDGDGGFSVSVCNRQHIFKPVSVQAMWSALQTLHKVSSKAREQKFYLGGVTHDWVAYYEQRIESDQSCLNEWHAMNDLVSKRPPSPDSMRSKPRQRTETETEIRLSLKEIMMSVDLDEVTSKYIRSRLEESLDMNLAEYKSFIDQEMLVILGQMDAPTEVFDHVFLGSEWNASNLEELQKNGVGHILNVTREIDNFFPGMFDYLNIRVYDDETTNLLKHWDNTFKYISRARKEGSKVLVHCKMGVSRSASVVIAYAMKAFNWDFTKALNHVKNKRSCIKPNSSFLAQLETYQGMLDAMKNKEKLQRSKSETNLKSPCKGDRIIPGAEPTPMIQAFQRSINAKKSPVQSVRANAFVQKSGKELHRIGARPKSWSPDKVVGINFTIGTAPPSVSFEQLNSNTEPQENFAHCACSQTVNNLNNSNNSNDERSKQEITSNEMETRSILTRENGQTYSISQNQIVHLPGTCPRRRLLLGSDEIVQIPSVKHRIIELESHSSKNQSEKKKSLTLNITPKISTANLCDDSCSNACSSTDPQTNNNLMTNENKISPPTRASNTSLTKKETWDPGEKVAPAPTGIHQSQITSINKINTCDCHAKNGDQLARLNANTNIDTQMVENGKILSSAATNCQQQNVKKEADPFSNHVDKVFDREERKQQRQSNSSNIPSHLNNMTIVEGLISSPALQRSSSGTREYASLQSSWSSYDSAVALSSSGDPPITISTLRDAPSRNSSWGSGDVRNFTIPSRNSSWGSYDITKSNSSSSNQLFEYHDLEASKINETTLDLETKKSKHLTCSSCDNCERGDDKTLISPIKKSTVQYASSPTLCECSKTESTNELKISPLNFRLSVSAPESSSLAQIHDPMSTSMQNLVQRNKNHERFNLNHVKPSRVTPRRCLSMTESCKIGVGNRIGLVRNLKKEFEAKNQTDDDNLSRHRIRSLPSSPVCAHVDIQHRDVKMTTSGYQSIDPFEDLSVKKLVNKYEVKGDDKTLKTDQKIDANKFPGHSSHVHIDFKARAPTRTFFRNKVSTKVDVKYGANRPPTGAAPTVVVRNMSNKVLAAVVTNAANKKQQQHGKTHPLSRLTIHQHPRHTNPVYNTM